MCFRTKECMKRPKRKKKTGRRTWRNDVVRYTRLSCLVAAGGGSAGASRCTSSDLRETLLVSEPPADLPRGGVFRHYLLRWSDTFSGSTCISSSCSLFFTLALIGWLCPPPQPPPRPPVHKKQQQSIVCTTLESSHAKTTR